MLTLQCVILATRPILLHLFRTTRHSKSTSTNTSATPARPMTTTLAETCVHSARHSIRLLLRSWSTGALPVLDYLSAQYTFAAAVILLLSSLTFETTRQIDRTDFESASYLLQQLKSSGNLPACEFCEHLDLVVESVATFEGKQPTSQTVSVPETANLPDNVALSHNVPISSVEALPSDFITTGMAIFDPMVQQFLTQDESQLDLPFLAGDDLFNDFDWFGTTTSNQEP